MRGGISFVLSLLKHPFTGFAGIGVCADVAAKGVKGYQPRALITLRRLLAEERTRSTGGALVIGWAH